MCNSQTKWLPAFSHSFHVHIFRRSIFQMDSTAGNTFWNWIFVEIKLCTMINFRNEIEFLVRISVNAFGIWCGGKVWFEWKKMWLVRMYARHTSPRVFDSHWKKRKCTRAALWCVCLVRILRFFSSSILDSWINWKFKINKIKVNAHYYFVETLSPRQLFLISAFWNIFSRSACSI